MYCKQHVGVVVITLECIRIFTDMPINKLRFLLDNDHSNVLEYTTAIILDPLANSY